MPVPTDPAPRPLELSVVAPAHNEAENVGPLVQQVAEALAAVPYSWEFLVVDDGSTDDTRERLRALMPARPWLRVVAMTRTPPGKGNGQSAAFHAGFRAARGRLIAVLDADLQNDPSEIPRLVERLVAHDAHLIQGDRSHARKDNAVRRAGSIVGRFVRRVLLNDPIRDTGCSLRVMTREVALQLPLQFRGMHRFIPITARHLGFTVLETPVAHRPRTAGVTKYGMGITQRALPGLIDLLAVRWMRARRRPTDATELRVAPEPPPRVIDAAVEVAPGPRAAFRPHAEATR